LTLSTGKVQEYGNPVLDFSCLYSPGIVTRKKASGISIESDETKFDCNNKQSNQQRTEHIYFFSYNALSNLSQLMRTSLLKNILNFLIYVVKRVVPNLKLIKLFIKK